MFDTIPPGLAATQTGISSVATGEGEEARNRTPGNKWFNVTPKLTFMKNGRVQSQSSKGCDMFKFIVALLSIFIGRPNLVDRNSKLSFLYYIRTKSYVCDGVIV